MLAGGNVVAHVHQRHGVVVVLFRTLELGGRTLHVLVAGIEVDRDPVRQFLAGAGHGFLQQALGFLKLALLQARSPAS